MKQLKLFVVKTHKGYMMNYSWFHGTRYTDDISKARLYKRREDAAQSRNYHCYDGNVLELVLDVVAEKAVKQSGAVF